MGDSSVFKKILKLFRVIRQPPPPRVGDQKYDDEEQQALKAGIIKELTNRNKDLPENLDILLEFVNLAKAGGYTFDPRQLPQMVHSGCSGCAD